MVHKVARCACLCLAVIVIASCATSQSRYALFGPSFPPKSADYKVEVFRESIPNRPFVRISRIDVHLEKTGLIPSSFEEVLPELKKQAQLSGADAVVEIREGHSRVGETRIYHVTATGIHYTVGAQ